MHELFSQNLLTPFVMSYYLRCQFNLHTSSNVTATFIHFALQHRPQNNNFSLQNSYVLALVEYEKDLGLATLQSIAWLSKKSSTFDSNLKLSSPVSNEGRLPPFFQRYLTETGYWSSLENCTLLGCHAASLYQCSLRDNARKRSSQLLQRESVPSRKSDTSFLLVNSNICLVFLFGGLQAV